MVAVESGTARPWRDPTGGDPPPLPTIAEEISRICLGDIFGPQHRAGTHLPPGPQIQAVPILGGLRFVEGDQDVDGTGSAGWILRRRLQASVPRHDAKAQG